MPRLCLKAIRNVSVIHNSASLLQLQGKNYNRTEQNTEGKGSHFLLPPSKIVFARCPRFPAVLSRPPASGGGERMIATQRVRCPLILGHFLYPAFLARPSSNTSPTAQSLGMQFLPQLEQCFRIYDHIT